MGATTPVVTQMRVVPVAGYDSMLMTLSGAHVRWEHAFPDVGL